MNVANKYWNATVPLLNVKTPKIQVIPSNGKSTVADLAPHLSRAVNDYK